MTKTPNGFSRFPSISTSYFGVLVLALLLAMMAVVPAVKSSANAFEFRLRQELVTRSAEAAKLSFERALSREWESLNAVAGRMAQADLDEARSFLDAVGRASNRIRWAGFADSTGRIIAGTEREREGENVASRRWFRDGMLAPVAAAVADQDALRVRAPNEEGGVINLSVPVRTGTGLTKGVMVYSLKVGWMRDYLTETAERMGADFHVLNADGSVVVSSNPEMSDLPPVVRRLMDGARAGGQQLQVAGEGNATQALYAVQPGFVGDTLPGTDWTLVTEMDRGDYGGAMPNLERSIWVILGVAALTVVAALLLHFNFIFRPFLRLIDSAAALSRGETEYPAPDRTSRESAALADALSRIQTEIQTPWNLRKRNRDTGGGPRTGMSG